MDNETPTGTDGILLGNDPYSGPSFSAANRARRAAWNLTYLLLFRFSPRPLHLWRASVLRLFGARLGKHVHIYPSVKIWAPWNLVCEDHVGVGDGANLYNMATIHLSHHAVVSQGAHLCTGTHDIHSTNFQLSSKSIHIQPYVWICAEAFLGPGANVAEGCVVGARCVLVKPALEVWTVWAGNPAQKVGNRRRIDTGGAS